MLLEHLTFYQLKMIDLDGQYEYSDIISVSTKKETPIQLSPNPISSNQAFYLSSEFADSDNIQVQITTITGQVLGSKKYPVDQNTKIEIQPSDFNLTSGQYILQLTDNKGFAKSTILQIH